MIGIFRKQDDTQTTTPTTADTDTRQITHSKASLYSPYKSAHYNDWMRDLARVTNINNP